MDQFLINNELVNYNTNDNLCAICLDPVINEVRLIISPINSNAILPVSTENSDEDFISVDLDSDLSSLQNSVDEVWTCNSCTKDFHLNCILEWKKGKEKFGCPICRESHTIDIHIIDFDKENTVHNQCSDFLINVMRITAGVILITFILTLVMGFIIWTNSAQRMVW